MFASSVDPQGYEERRWRREEGKILSDSVELAYKNFDEDGEFELVQARSMDPHTMARAVVLKSMKSEIATLFFKIGQDHLVIWLKANEQNGWVAYPVVQESIPLPKVDGTSLDASLTKLLATLKFTGID